MQAKKLILQDYQVEWILDDMPSSTAFYTSEVKTKRYRTGFPLGQTIVSPFYKLVITHTHFSNAYLCYIGVIFRTVEPTSTIISL
jgi:Endomembrane protein 70